jgi:hypothetical protein
MTYSQIIGLPGAPGTVGVSENTQDAEIALLGATTAAMNLYVDPVSGVDTNPGTAALPFRTIAAALAAVPQTIKHLVTINLADGDYNEYLELSRFEVTTGILLLQGNLGLATGEIQRTADIFSASTIGTALSGWGINANEDKWVTIISGMGAGQTKKIAFNTADTNTITSKDSFNPVPNATSIYEIRTPKARILGTAPFNYASGGYPSLQIMRKNHRDQGGIQIYGIEFVNGPVKLDSIGYVCMSGCSLKRGLYGFMISQLRLGSLYYSPEAPASTVYRGHGCYIGNDGGKALYLTHTFIVMEFSVRVGDCYFFYDRPNIYSSHFRASTTFKFESCWTEDDYASPTINGMSCIDYNYIRVRNSSLSMVAKLDNAAVTALLLDIDSFVVGTLTGAGNTGAAVIAKNSSEYCAYGANTITGAGGEFKCGSRPAETWAGLATQVAGDTEDQSFTSAVPANPGPWTIALGRALRGVLSSGLVRVHDTTANAMLVEAAPAPGAGQFSVDYATGVITFNTAEQTHAVVIYYRPVQWQNCVVRNYV